MPARTQKKIHSKFVPRETLVDIFFFHDFRIVENGVWTRWKKILEYSRQLFNFCTRTAFGWQYISHSMAAQIRFFLFTKFQTILHLRSSLAQVIYSSESFFVMLKYGFWTVLRFEIEHHMR